MTNVGGRHDFSLKTAGFLAREIGLPESEARNLVRILGVAANDDECRDSNVTSTYRKLEAGQPIDSKLPIEEEDVAQLKKWLKACERGGSGRVTQVDLAIRIMAQECELWHTPEEKAHLTVDGASFPVRATKAKTWLANRYFERHGKNLSRKVRDEAIDWAEARALQNGATHKAWLRYGAHEGAIYVDLGTTDRRVVKITRDGWEVIAGKDCPVRFVRSPNTGPLPLPERGGKVDLLWRHLNIIDDHSRVCLIGWLFGAIRPAEQTGYPILVYEGEAGCAKTTSSRFCAALVDPQIVEAGGSPGNDRDFMVQAKAFHCVRLDNLRTIDARLSDAVCRLSTGGGQFNRANYTDDELACFDVRRPCILNGIDRVVKAEDVIDRAVIISLQPIPSSQRKTDQELWAAFNEDAPKILGALYDAGALALKRLPEIKVENLPRLADWGKWVEAGAPGFGWSDGQFLTALRKVKSEATHAVFAEDPLVSGIMDLLGDKDVWEDTTAKFRLHLIGTSAYGDPRLSSPQKLAAAMRRLQKPLRELGIICSPYRKGKGHTPMTKIERKIIP